MQAEPEHPARRLSRLTPAVLCRDFAVQLAVVAAMFRNLPDNTIRFGFRVSRYGPGIRIVVFGQVRCRTSDACELTERSLDHVAVFGL